MPREPERLIYANHPDQRIVGGRNTCDMYLRVDGTHELPIVVYNLEYKPIARFATAGDAAAFLCAPYSHANIDRTLPAPIVAELARLATRTPSAA